VHEKIKKGLAETMSWQRQVKKIVLLLFAITAFGVVGFMLVEGWSFFDSLYMTVITFSTVGYNEVHTLSPGGRAFVIVLIVLGVGTFLYMITSIAEFVVTGEITGALGRRRMNKAIDSLNNHYIVCGYGRVGIQVALELKREGVPFVVIDTNPDSIQACSAEGYLYIEGDASNDETLKEAGIFRARGLVTATDEDADNVYITLSARNLKGDLFIVARANLEKSQYKLRKAGADRVISPYSIGGRRLASLLLRPTVVEFLDVVMHSAEIELLMEEVMINEKSPFVGATMEDVRRRCAAGANILALKKKGEKKLVPNPSPETVVEMGDRFVALGTKDQLRELEGLT
jgi:voltage-gated potassium channel